MIQTNLRLYAGIFLLSVSTLTFEVSLTRIFSVSLWYHFAFMVISIAMLGFGASGSLLMIFPTILNKGLLKTLSLISLLFSTAIVLSYLAVNQVPFDPARISWDYNQILFLLVYYSSLSIPFLLSGSAISIAIAALPDKVGFLYFTNLIGAGIGCLLIFIVFSSLGGLGGILIPSILGLCASLLFGLTKKLNILTGVLVVYVVFLLVSRPGFMEINISPYKGLMTALRYPDSQLIDTQWNVFSRVDIVESPAVRFAPGLSLRYLGPLPPQMGISVDGDHLNAITQYDGQRDTIAFTSYLPSAAAFHTGKIREVLILEPMGGLDVLSALYHGAKHIEGIESNPLIVKTIKGRYREFSGNIFEHDRVNISIGEARSYLRRSDKKFDLIQISISNTFGAFSTGIHGLSEDYMFTEEAFEEYFGHLNGNGFLSVTRYLLPPPRTELRIISLALSSLEKMGIENPETHLAVLRSWGTITLLLKAGEIGNKDIINLKEFCGTRRFDLVYYPGIKKEEVNIFNKFKEPVYYQLISLMTDKERREDLYDQYLFNIRSVTDDRPFFYHLFRWDRLKELYMSMGKKWQPFMEGAYLVPVVFVQALILSIIFIIIPAFLRKREKQRIDPHGKGFLLAYFFFIGVGFMFIEISLIQKFILFLGQPAYAVSLVLFAILVWAGIGSYLSNFLVKAEKFRLISTILVLVGMISLFVLILPGVLDLTLGKSLIFRLIFTVVLITPLGIFMGMPFPLGIRVLCTYSKSLIPWAWCVNGCSSVLSAIMAVMVAISLGYNGVLICSAGAYLIGLASMKWGMRRVREG